MKGIGRKIALLFVLSSIILTVLMGTISGFESSNLLINEAKDKTELLAQNKSIGLSGQMDIMVNAVDNLATNISSKIDESKISDENYMQGVMGDINKLVEGSAKSVDGNTDAYAIFSPEVTKSSKVYHCLLNRNKDTFEDAGEILTLEQLNPKDETMKWYFKPIEEKKGVWSEPYVDQNLNTKLITYSRPVYINEKLIAVVGMDIKFEVFEDIVKSIKTYDTGYAFLLNKNYSVLSHPSIEAGVQFDDEMGEKGKAIFDIMQKQNTGVEELEFNGQSKILGFSKLKNGFIFVVTTPKNEVLNGVHTMIYILGGVGIALVIIGIGLGIFTGNSIAKPIRKLMNVMKEVENGNLNCNIDIVSKDEIGQLVKSFNSMLQGERSIINEVNNTSDDTKNSASMLVDTSNKMSYSYNEMASAVHEITQSSSVQAGALGKIVADMEEFNGHIGRVLEAAQEVELETQGINNMAKDSDNQLKIVIDLISSINSAFAQVKSGIVNLTSDLTEVTSVIEVINDIAVQTNLLALNASIEAARAGEAGRSFAIVAGEIGQLAEQTKISSGNISNSLNGISQTASGVLSTTENVSEEFSNQVNIMQTAINSFEKIVNAVETILPSIQNITISVDNINKKKDGITSNIETVSAVAEEVSAATEEVSASIEEMNESSQNVVNTAQHLELLSSKLNDQVKRFNL